MIQEKETYLQLTHAKKTVMGLGMWFQGRAFKLHVKPRVQTLALLKVQKQKDSFYTGNVFGFCSYKI